MTLYVDYVAMHSVWLTPRLSESRWGIDQVLLYLYTLVVSPRFRFISVPVAPYPLAGAGIALSEEWRTSCRNLAYHVTSVS